MRTLLSFLALALIGLGATQARAQAQAITLTSSDVIGAPGDVVTVSIDASGLVGTGDLQIVKFAVEFDGTMLEALGATPGTAIGGWPAEDVQIDLLDGRVAISGITSPAITLSEGLFFSLDFEVREGVIDGSTTSFDLVGGSPKDPILLQGDPDDDATRVKVTTFDGTFTVEGGAICTPGDALADGETSVADAVVVLRIVAGLASADTPVAACNADADADGSVTAGDAVVVLRRVVGLARTYALAPATLDARLVRDDRGARLVIDRADAVHGLSFTVDGDVAVSGVSSDALGVTSMVDGRTRVAFASASALGRGALEIDLAGFTGDAVEDLRAFDAEGRSIEVAFTQATPGVRSLVELANYPNPFNPSTTIEFSLPAAGRARLELFNARGERVRVLVDEMLPAGASSVVWNGTDANGRAVSSGVYYAQIVVGDTVARQRMVLLK